MIPAESVSRGNLLYLYTAIGFRIPGVFDESRLVKSSAVDGHADLSRKRMAWLLLAGAMRPDVT